MSLLRLLTTGKSLVSISDAESRYRVTSQRLLPHFGADRNPFSSSGKAEPTHTGPRPLGDHGPTGTLSTMRSVPALSGGREAVPQTRPEGKASLLSSNRHSPSGVLRGRMSALLDGWKERLVGLFAHRRCKATKRVIPRFPKPPVQGELSLDRIKVLRNDLSDADLEIVRAKPPTVPAMRAVEDIAGARNAWGRLTARIPGVGKTHSDEDQ
jgi:hypothetical protein